MHRVEFVGGPLDGIRETILNVYEDFKCRVYLDEDGNELKEPTLTNTDRIAVIRYRVMKRPNGADYVLGSWTEGFRWIMVEENFWNWYHFYAFYSSRTY